MALETATYISGLVAANPLLNDPKAQGDDHIRLLKAVLLATLPGLTGAVTATHAELNYVAGVTSSIQTQLNGKYAAGDALGTPSSGTLTNCSGTAASLTAGQATAALGIKSATTTVSVSSATAPSAGQTLVATSSTAATWQTVPAGSLSSITAASSANTLASGNNAIAFNWWVTGATTTGFSIGETTASTGGAGGQALFAVGTLAGSTANPFTVKTRGVNVLAINYLGEVTITSLTGASGSGGDGSNITITSGTSAVGLGTSGAIAISTGAPNGTSNVGGITISTPSGAAGGTASGAISITCGTTYGANAGKALTLSAGAAVSSLQVGGAVNISAGNSGASTAGADIVMTTGTGSANGRINFVNCNVANGSVATTINSLGPTGAATTIQGWLAIKVGGTARYIPFW